jgi:hypothetical protein
MSLAEKLKFDVDFETARAIHRVVRGMHDGECPKCHTLFDGFCMRLENGSEQCPKCFFSISYEEIQAAMKAFAPVMERNLEVFEKWRERIN